MYMYMNKTATVKCAEVKPLNCVPAKNDQIVTPAKPAEKIPISTPTVPIVPETMQASALATGFYNKSIHERFLQVRNKHIKMRVARVEVCKNIFLKFF